MSLTSGASRPVRGHALGARTENTDVAGRELSDLLPHRLRRGRVEFGGRRVRRGSTFRKWRGRTVLAPPGRPVDA